MRQSIKEWTAVEDGVFTIRQSLGEEHHIDYEAGMNAHQIVERLNKEAGGAFYEVVESGHIQYNPPVVSSSVGIPVFDFEKHAAARRAGPSELISGNHKQRLQRYSEAHSEEQSAHMKKHIADFEDYKLKKKTDEKVLEDYVAALWEAFSKDGWVDKTMPAVEWAPLIPDIDPLKEQPPMDLARGTPEELDAVAALRIMPTQSSCGDCKNYQFLKGGCEFELGTKNQSDSCCNGRFSAQGGSDEKA